MAQDTEIAVHPELRELVREASRALSLLDADRLEELALSCRALNRALAETDSAKSIAGTREIQEATGEMARFGRVLEATRGNLRVLHRLREIRTGSLEYAARSAGKES
jgi:hypothetical protein